MTTDRFRPRQATAPAAPARPRHGRALYRNDVPRRDFSTLEKLGLWLRFFFSKPTGTRPDGGVPVLPLTPGQLAAAPDKSLYRLGHSTLLIKLGGGYVLTDPVFGQRASPVPWAGPRRFHAPPIAVADLPPLAAVILSHNHYDHLDRQAIVDLRDKTGVFFAPLGVGDSLIAWGVPRDRVRQLDWWQSATVAGTTLLATPSRHFSGRGLGDTDATLWASFAILADGLRLFFGADSGYFRGFAEIGQRVGPFDVTCLECGAYDAMWPEVHMQPEETLQAHRDLGGGWLVPIHNGTFDLAFHPWTEPFERLTALAGAQGVRLATPRMGERLDLAAPRPGPAWWRETP